MKTYIQFKTSVEALHRWENAKDFSKEIEYLSNLHRHIFIITCKSLVMHLDRDKEFLMESHRVKEYLTNNYWAPEYRCLNFDYRSCEMIAVELFEKFDLEECIVSEDGENSAIVCK